jgi:hypothetical protein
MATSKKNGSKGAASKALAATAANAIAGPVVTLADIVAAGEQGMFTATAIHGPLVEAGLVEINPGIVNESGEIATRATVAGVRALATHEKEDAIMDNNKEEVGAVAETIKSGFVIESNIPVPAITGRGRGANVYPFDELAVGQSFFVANTTDKPNAAKSLASTVSSATARYAVADPDGKTEAVKVTDYKVDAEGKREKGEDGKPIVIGQHDELRPIMHETRKFIVRSVEGGARVWRMA